MALGTTRLGPMLVGYELGWIPASRRRAAAAYLCCRGRPEQEPREIGVRYGQTLTRWFRPEAIERIRWHRYYRWRELPAEGGVLRERLGARPTR